MANPAQSPAQFLTNLLAAVRALTGRRPPPTWTHVDKLQHKLATGNRDAFDAARALFFFSINWSLNKAH